MVQCPVCESENDYQRVAQHWAKTCKFPQPEEAARSVFVGLYLTGASVEWGDTHPRIRKRSQSKPALEWIGDEAGIWSSSLKQTRTVTTDDEYLADGEDKRVTHGWRWTSVACPWLEHVADRDVEDLASRVDDRALRVLVSFKGHQVDGNLQIVHPQQEALASVLADMGYDGTTRARDGRTSGRVTLDRASSRSLFEAIGEPLPGVGEKFDSGRLLAFEDPPRWQHRDVLEQFIERGYTYSMLVDEFDCSDNTLSKWLDRHGLEPSPVEPEYPDLEDPEWLREQYHEKGMTQAEIADEVGAVKQTVSRRMREHGIETQ